LQKIYTDNWVSFNGPKREKIKEGNIVKISNGRESFWVIVREITDINIIGEVNNDLLGEQAYNCGDLVSFGKKNIREIYSE
jgi:hypothetical protein